MVKNYLEIKNVENLHVLQLSIELAKRIEEIYENLPFSEQHTKDQIVRAYMSIVQNISRGEQIYPKQKCNFYSVAIGSAQEVKTWLMICTGKRLISEGEFLELESIIDRIIKMFSKILENLNNKMSDVEFSLSPIGNIRFSTCWKIATDLARTVFEIEISESNQFYLYVKKQLENMLGNIASHVSESEQHYSRKKLQGLNLAVSECHSSIAFLKILMEGDVIGSELYHEIKDSLEKIRNFLLEEIKEIDSEVKVLI